tara:strand:- start:134 stop:1117 length:984 start_codon:yes stop_codon:yes gene_type:complete
MFNEDDEVATEVAETTETAETSTVSDAVAEPAESVESADVSGETAADAVPDETAADALEETPALFDWNGEVTALKEAEWIKSLDPTVRASVLSGVQSKYRNLERGYTKAYQENAAKRKSLEKRAQEIKDTELRVQKWLHGDIDPMEEKQRELDLIKQHHDSALETLHKEHEKALMKAQSGHADEIEKLIESREAAQSRIAQYEAEKEAQETAALEAEVDSFENWVKDAAPHVYNDERALYALCTTVASGIDKADALKMVLALHPTPEPEKPSTPMPEPVPEAVEMMNMGASAAANTEETNNLSFDDRMDLLRRQAMADEVALLNSVS